MVMMVTMEVEVVKVAMKGVDVAVAARLGNDNNNGGDGSSDDDE